MDAFDILGPLPGHGTTTVLEASAGTGKTYTIGALVARFVAEGTVPLDEMLVITFGRAATREMRERVRAQLVEAERALADPSAARATDGLIGHLADCDDHELVARRRRLIDALATFDGATIATTHEFCHLVLRSLGVAGDTDSNATLVEDLDDLVVEVVDDLYLRRFGDSNDPPAFSRDTALAIARRVVQDPQSRISPVEPEPGSASAARAEFGADVRSEIGRRKRRRGLLSFDDLLSRLADALADAKAPARERMRQRWSIVLVDEFQDTDPVQWNVIDRAFSDVATLVLIGDPKQAIYAFRGGDIVTYLAAAETAATRQTLATNHRSDGALVDALQVLTRGARLGDPRIAVHPVQASHPGRRLVGPTMAHPVRLRVVERDPDAKPTIGIDELRVRIAADLADDVARLLSSGATFEGRDVRAADVAILMYSLKHVDLFRAALRERGIPSVVAGSGSVLSSEAGDAWLAVLEALERQSAPRVRTVALGPFIGETPASLDAGGDDRTDRIAEQVRGWLDLLRARGIAAVHEAIAAAGLAERVLSRPDGERLLTDLKHVGEILNEVSRREALGLPALLEWVRTRRRETSEAAERTRRLDTDAAAVQIVTIHGSKGLQYPIVYLPTEFDYHMPKEDLPRFHVDQVRMVDIGGNPTDDVIRRAHAEDAAEKLRLTYVALTRAQSQLVLWWAPSWNATNSGLSRLIFGRGAGDADVPDEVDRGPSDATIATVLGDWERAGAFQVERAEGDLARVEPREPDSTTLSVRRLDRSIDTDWRRTSYSGLIRAEEQVVTSAIPAEPEDPGTVDEDEPEDEQPETPPAPADEPLLSPMNDLPAGALFGSLVHGVLEHADPMAPDLRAELQTRFSEELRWWTIDATADVLADALLPMLHTPLGPLADDLRLVDIPMSDRLSELDFELPLTGGDHPSRSPSPSRLRDVARVMRRHLADDDPIRAYADRLESPSLGDQSLRGYLSGSIDVVLRVADPGAGHRYLVVDYKTNKLGVPDRAITALDYTPSLMTEAMLHSHYPLQAMLYSAALHRFLRWRQVGYDPERHLGGVLYLYLRGMCGPETPVIDGHPCGVFAWRPPTQMVVELSDLLAGVEVPA